MPASRPLPHLLALATLAALALTACGKNPTKPSYIAETTLFGYLYVGEPISSANALWLGETRPVDAYYDSSRAAVTGALVLLQAEGAPQADTLRMVAPGRYANPAVVIAPRTTYHLTAIAGPVTLTATTTTPGALTMAAEPQVLPAVMPLASIAAAFPMVVDGPDPEQLMAVDVYCLESYTNAEYVNPFGNQRTPKDYKEYGGDNGEPRHIATYFRLKDLGPRGGNGYRLGFYGDMMAFYGEYTVGVFAIDENYYQYLYRDYPERHGGVNGGIGVFGSAWRRQYHVKAVR
jgi:hypothetical protein